MPGPHPGPASGGDASPRPFVGWSEVEGREPDNGQAPAPTTGGRAASSTARHGDPQLSPWVVAEVPSTGNEHGKTALPVCPQWWCRPDGIGDMLLSSPAAEAVSPGSAPRFDPGRGPDGSEGAGAGDEVVAGLDVELGEDVPEVELDGLKNNP